MNPRSALISDAMLVAKYKVKLMCTVSVFDRSATMMPMFPQRFPSLPAAMDFIEEKIVALFDAGAEFVTIDEEGRGSENYLARNVAKNILAYEYLELGSVDANWA